METENLLGQVLAKRRIATGISTARLAKQIGLRQSQLKDIEQGVIRPDEVLLGKLAAALGTTFDEMMIEAGEVPPGLAPACAQHAGEVAKFLASLKVAMPPASTSISAPTPSPQPDFETKLGRLYRGDCLSIMPTIPPETVDCIFADPPFNLAKDYGEGINDSIEDREYLRWSRSWIQQAIRLLKPGGSFFLWNLPKWNLPLGSYIGRHLRFRHWVAVDIKYCLPIPGRLYPSHYSLLYFVKGDRPSTFNPPRLPMETCRHCGGELKDYGGYKDRMNPQGINLTDVWIDIPPVRHRRYKNRSANELALKLIDRVLDIATNEGDLVLDPFGGGGTTYAACELRGRRWIGIELGEVKPIIDRLSDLGDEKEQLNRIRSKINVLFFSEALELRRRHGHDTSRYRVNSRSSSSEDVQSAQTLLPNLGDLAKKPRKKKTP